MAAKYSGLIEPLARYLWGDPNEQLSKPDDLRFGNHGSKSVSLEKNTFYDHEANEGGGVIQLVQYATGIKTPGVAHEWLEKNGFIDGDASDIPMGREVMQVMKSCTAPESPPAAFTPKPRKTPAKIVATYDYRDEVGDLLMQVVRMEPKTFRQRRPDPSASDGWVWSVKGVRVVPYRLPQLLAAPDAVVYLVEGEKDADRLAALGLVATTNVGGAGKWRKEDSEFLRGRSVVILPDNDEPGQAHAQKVVKAMKGIVADVRIVTLPGLPEKGDVSDWLDSGGTMEELLQMVSSTSAAAPVAPAGDDDEGESRKLSQTDLLVKFVKERFDLLHDKNGDTYARDRHTGEVRRLGARQFRDRVTAGFYEVAEVAVRDQAWREALGTLQALARFEGDPQEVHIRIAGRNGRYWIDLCQAGSSRAVEIDAAGWRIVDRAPVLFVRGEAMQPLPTPTQGGSIEPLWDIANVPEQQRLLVLAWLVDSMRPDTPYPGLELVGEQGSGKSTAAEALRRLIDPNGCNLRGAPKTVEDIFVAAGQNHAVCYENVSHLAGPMQDALAILSTGGGFAKRQLYTDGEEHVISVRRPWMVNGISVSVTQQDLVDRVISVECPVIAARQSSSQQWQAFEHALPGVLGALFDLAVGALRELPNVSLPREDRPRLVEYVLLGMALTKATGAQQSEFLEQFKATRAETVARTLDASPVAGAVLEFIDTNPSGIEANVKDILIRLDSYKPMGAEAWPRTPKGLGDALRRASPALRQMGIECKSLGNIGGKVKWVIRRKPPAPSYASHHVMPLADTEHDFKTSMTSSPAQKFDVVEPI
jgi:hypothetical protein